MGVLWAHTGTIYRVYSVKLFTTHLHVCLTLHLCRMYGRVMYVWIPTPCLNAFWHGCPFILLHFLEVFYYKH